MLVTALANHMDLDIPELPQPLPRRSGWNKATIDGVFAGLAYTHLHLSPLSQAPGLSSCHGDVEKLTGGKVALGDELKLPTA